MGGGGLVIKILSARKNKTKTHQTKIKKSRQSHLWSEESQGVKRQPKPWKRGSRGCGSWTSPVSGSGSRQSRSRSPRRWQPHVARFWLSAESLLLADSVLCPAGRGQPGAMHAGAEPSVCRRLVASRSRTRFTAFESRPSPLFCLHGSFAL